jgi:hypothetical protein
MTHGSTPRPRGYREIASFPLLVASPDECRRAGLNDSILDRGPSPDTAANQHNPSTNLLKIDTYRISVPNSRRTGLLENNRTIACGYNTIGVTDNGFVPKFRNSRGWQPDQWMLLPYPFPLILPRGRGTDVSALCPVKSQIQRTGRIGMCPLRFVVAHTGHNR